MIKEALWVGWMDGMGLVIIGNRSSKSTFGANNYVVHMYILKKIFGVSR